MLQNIIELMRDYWFGGRPLWGMSPAIRTMELEKLSDLWVCSLDLRCLGISNALMEMNHD